MKTFKYSSTGKQNKFALPESNLNKKISKAKKQKLEEIEEEEVKKEVKEQLQS